MLKKPLDFLESQEAFFFYFPVLEPFVGERYISNLRIIAKQGAAFLPFLGVELMTSGIFIRQRRCFFVALATVLALAGGFLAYPSPAMARDKAEAAGAMQEVRATEASVVESDVGESPSIFSRALRAGPVVFLVLFVLVSLSIVTWGALVSKWWHFKKVSKASDAFVKSFWDSRSLNDLNSRLQEYPYSPAREIFRSGYAELVRGTQLRENSPAGEMVIGAAIENLSRALHKAKMFERRRMERFQSLLATSASASPFIGLFGTVWGIMGAFEGIAQTGSASLAAVAPGISEALIATAFGLAAAIPAVVGFNFFNSLIRSQLINLDGFCADFLNIVERYLVTEKKPGQVHHV